MNLHNIDDRNNAEIGRFFAGILGIVLLVMVPLRSVAVSEAETAKAYAETSVDEFVEEAGYSGRILLADYERLINRLESTGTVYEVEICVSEDLVTEEGVRLFQVSYTEEVLENLYAGMEYGLPPGTALSVYINPLKESVAERIAEMFMGNPGMRKGYCAGWKL